MSNILANILNASPHLKRQWMANSLSRLIPCVGYCIRLCVEPTYNQKSAFSLRLRVGDQTKRSDCSCSVGSVSDPMYWTSVWVYLGSVYWLSELVYYCGVFLRWFHKFEVLRWVVLRFALQALWMSSCWASDWVRPNLFQIIKTERDKSGETSLTFFTLQSNNRSPGRLTKPKVFLK